jgi:uncharacterized protein (DUF1501 family)
MLNRREFLSRSLKGASLLAVGSVVPQFIANTARAAEAGKDTILVVIEMTGGNDGLNTVIPYTDELYYKYRPTLGVKKEQAVRVTDEIGLNPALRSFDQLLQRGELAIVQGVGYPNPDRSHFESMDIWQSADPKRKTPSGWIGRSVPDLQDKNGNVPVVQLGADKLPLALQGTPSGVVSINNRTPYRLELAGGSKEQQGARRKLIEELAQTSDKDQGDLLQFVQRRQLQTYATLEKLQELLKRQNVQGFIPEGIDFEVNGRGMGFGNLFTKLQLVAAMIQQEFGTRVFYVAIDGFDTHSNQAETHRRLFEELSNAVTFLFNQLRGTGHDKRTLVMTFSEFGRRVQENGSRGTDHGSGSCLFVAGPGVKAGPVGKHPSLSELDQGDLKYHTDFRRVYATLLDGWLKCDSRHVLGDKFEHLDLLKKA